MSTTGNDTPKNTGIKPKPPHDTILVMRVADLPQDRRPAQYSVQYADRAKVHTFSKRLRQVLDLLRRGPVFCASPVRISQAVMELREDYGFDIETKRYPGNPITGAGSYGVYFLKTETALIDRVPHGEGV